VLALLTLQTGSKTHPGMLLSSWLWKFRSQTSDRASTKRTETVAVKSAKPLRNLVEGSVPERREVRLNRHKSRQG